MQVGQTYTVPNRMPEPWFPGGYPETITCTVQKVFKNGKVAVAVNELPNASDDGKRTLHFPAAFLLGQADIENHRHP